MNYAHPSSGHETTSSLLAFAFYNLLSHPEAYHTAQAEVDRVVGTGAVRANHLKDLEYLNAVLRESIRLYPTAPAITLQSRAKQNSHFRLGEYLVPTDVPVLVALEKVHRDPKVWGEDAEEFKPERMLNEKFNTLPKNAWKASTPRPIIGRLLTTS